LRLLVFFGMAGSVSVFSGRAGRSRFARRFLAGAARSFFRGGVAGFFPSGRSATFLFLCRALSLGLLAQLGRAADS